MTIALPYPDKGAWTPEQIVALRDGYANGEGPKDIALRINRTSAAVRNKAYELGVTRNRAWSEEEVALLRAAYAAHPKGVVCLEDIAQQIGRDRMAVALKASKLGLGDPSRPRVEERKDRRKFKGDEEALRKFKSENAKALIRENGHPRGFAGGSHTPETRAAISKKAKAAWASKTPEERDAWAEKLAHSHQGAPKVERGTWKAGWREIGGKRNYYRSRWEANYARYLEWLKQNGEIADWQHEPETFWFEAIKRGVRSYKPDFRVWEVNGQSNLHEVKGWMDARSKTTLKRMAKYYPAETVIVVREKQYNEIARKVGPLIEGWEIGSRADCP